MRKNVVFYVTRQYMKQNKGRTFTTFAGIVFMVLLMTCVFVGKDTGIRYLQDVASLKDGKWHVSMYEITTEEYEKVLQTPGVKETAVSAAYGCTEFAASADPERPYLNVKAYTAPCFDWMNIQLMEGRLPKNSKEIIVSRSAVDDGAKLSIGDQVEADFFERSITGIDPEVEKTVFPFQGITLKYGETKEVPETFPYWGENESFRENRQYTGQKESYEVVGIMEAPSFEETDAAGYTAVTFLEQSQAAALETFNLSMLLDVQGDSYFELQSLIETAGDHEIDINDYVLAFTADTSDSTFNLVVRYMTVFFVALIMAASVLLIYNVFDMSFQERSRYLGMLCSVGATGRQKRSSIFYEAFLLLIFALPAGILLGIGVIRLAMAAFRPLIGSLMRFGSMVEIDPAVLCVSWENLAAAAATSIVTVLISAWLPARKIGKIGPVECIRGNVSEKNRRYGMDAAFIDLFGAEGMLAKNMLLRRNKKVRSVSLAAAVFMVVCVVTIFGSDAVHRVIGAKTDGEMDLNSNRYDYMVFPRTAEYEALKEEIGEDPGVETVSEWRSGMFAGQVPGDVYGKEYWNALHEIFNLYYHRELSDEEFLEESCYDSDDNRSVNVLSVDSSTLREMARLTGADIEKLLDPGQMSAIVVQTGSVSTSTFTIDQLTPERYRLFHISHMTDLKEGDTIPMSVYSPQEDMDVELPLEIAGAADAGQLEDYVHVGNNFYMWLIVNEDIGAKIAELTREEDRENGWMDPMLLVRLSGEPADIIERLQRGSEQEDSEYRIIEVGYLDNIVDAITDIVDVMMSSFVLLTSVICLLNLFNSIRGWILESRQELAALRSVGMAGGQMRKMVLYECAGIFLWAVLLSGVCSGGLICVVRIGLTRIFGNVEIPIPWLWMTAAAAAVGVVLTALSLYGFGKERQEELFEGIRRESV